jgi:Ca-activated chloride channel family protein
VQTFLPRTVLPLKSVHYQFVVRGGLAEVQMTQVYRQENEQPLDCEYLFPLPADGAVYRCEAAINGRIIRARIEEREAARRLVAEKKAEGRRTALVESERENLFTLSLGNVQPQDVVEVTLAYLQPLRRQGAQVTLDLPLCPGVRYIPGRALLRSNRGTGTVDDTDQVPDASRITPPRIDGDHPDAAFVELDGRIDATFLDGEVASPSHHLGLARRGDLLRLTLAKGGEVPDRDLSLRWQEREPAQPALRGWTSQSDGHGFALLELRAPASIEATNAVPQDVYFLVDRSGSMRGEKWEKAIQALHGCVGVLSPKDRVWVTLFESTFQDFDAEPALPAALLADRRFRDLAAVGTTGGTEMEPALRHILAKVKQFSQDRPAVLVLITDAQIGNEGEIVALMREHPELPVHCFGIDTTLNDSLLLDLVRQQGGTFHALEPSEDVAGRVTQLGRTLRQPVLTGLQVSEGWELAAGAMPNLYAGQTHLVSVRSQGAPESKRLTVAARDHRNQPVKLNFKLAAVTEAAPRLRWCKERLVSLAAKDDKAAAIALSRESNLLCPLTAFVAWDNQEKVAVAAQ